MNHLHHFKGSGYPRELGIDKFGNYHTVIRDIEINVLEKCVEEGCTFTLGQIAEVYGKYKPKKDIIISPVDL